MIILNIELGVGGAMLKKGDKCKEGKTGIVYTVREVTNSVIMLETDDGLHRILINWDGLDSSCVKVQRKNEGCNGSRRTKQR